MITKEHEYAARLWVGHGDKVHERARDMLDLDADMAIVEADDAHHDGDHDGADKARRDASILEAARDALDAVPGLLAEVERLRGGIAEARTSERAAILAHIREKANLCARHREYHDTAAEMLREAADEIEAGEHIETGVAS